LRPPAKDSFYSLLAAGVSHAQPTTLKDAFQGIFRTGAALNQSWFEEKDGHGSCRTFTNSATAGRSVPRPTLLTELAQPPEGPVAATVADKPGSSGVN